MINTTLIVTKDMKCYFPYILERYFLSSKLEYWGKDCLPLCFLNIIIILLKPCLFIRDATSSHARSSSCWNCSSKVNKNLYPFSRRCVAYKEKGLIGTGKTSGIGHLQIPLFISTQVNVILQLAVLFLSTSNDSCNRDCSFKMCIPTLQTIFIVKHS